MNTELHQTILPSEGCGTCARGANLGRQSKAGTGALSRLFGRGDLCAALAGLGPWRRRATPSGRVAATPLRGAGRCGSSALGLHLTSAARRQAGGLWRLRTAAEVDQEADRHHCGVGRAARQGQVPMESCPWPA